MFRAFMEATCRVMDRDSTWWGMRRLKPAPDQPYNSWTLLLVWLACGLPTAVIVYGAAYLALTTVDPFGDDTSWLPRAAAWAAFVLQAIPQAFGCWLWNRRAARLNPSAFPYRRVGGAG